MQQNNKVSTNSLFQAPASRPGSSSPLTPEGLFIFPMGSRAICLDEGSTFYGWWFQRGPEKDQWVTDAKATEVQLSAAKALRDGDGSGEAPSPTRSASEIREAMETFRRFMRDERGYGVTSERNERLCIDIDNFLRCAYETVEDFLHMTELLPSKSVPTQGNPSVTPSLGSPDLEAVSARQILIREARKHGRAYWSNRKAGSEYPWPLIYKERRAAILRALSLLNAAIASIPTGCESALDQIRRCDFRDKHGHPLKNNAGFVAIVEAANRARVEEPRPAAPALDKSSEYEDKSRRNITRLWYCPGCGGWEKALENMDDLICPCGHVIASFRGAGPGATPGGPA